MFRRLSHIVADHRDDISGFDFTIGPGSTVAVNLFQITNVMKKSVSLNDKKGLY